VLTLLSSLTVLVTGVTAGGLAFMARGVTPATPTLRPGTFTELHSALYRFADPLMPALVCASTLACAGLGAALAARADGAATALAAVATAALIGVIVITETVNKPINKRVDTWSPAAPPPDWGAVRDRWNTFHLRRTLCGLVAYACAMSAALLSL
jgi:uncharacterized membrane protein